MGIIEIRAKKIFAGPGTGAWLAEALVKDKKGEERYAAVHYYDGEEYTVSRESVYDFLAGGGEEPASGFLEEYDDADDAEESDFAEVFEALRTVIEMLE